MSGGIREHILYFEGANATACSFRVHPIYACHWCTPATSQREIRNRETTVALFPARLAACTTLTASHSFSPTNARHDTKCEQPQPITHHANSSAPTSQIHIILRLQQHRSTHAREDASATSLRAPLRHRRRGAQESATQATRMAPAARAVAVASARAGALAAADHRRPRVIVPAARAASRGRRFAPRRLSHLHVPCQRLLHPVVAKCHRTGHSGLLPGVVTPTTWQLLLLLHRYWTSDRGRTGHAARLRCWPTRGRRQWRRRAQAPPRHTPVLQPHRHVSAPNYTLPLAAAHPFHRRAGQRPAAR